MPGSIRSMQLEHVLRNVQTDRGSLLHGRLLRWQFDTVTLAHRCRRGASTPSPQAEAGRRPAEMARRYRPETPVPDWRNRLVCSRCGSHDTDMVVTGERRWNGRNPGGGNRGFVGG